MLLQPLARSAARNLDDGRMTARNEPDGSSLLSPLCPVLVPGLHGQDPEHVCARFSVKRGHERIRSAVRKEDRPRSTEVGQVNLAESRV
jgi:hypothetical protein